MLMNYSVIRKEREIVHSSSAGTEIALEKALNGDIPAVTLKTMELNRTMVAAMLAKELLVLHYAAEGAKMSLVALMLRELHIGLTKKSSPEKRDR
jgi:hypothetical protein